MQEYRFRGVALSVLRALVLRGAQSRAGVAGDLNCTEQELLRALARRPSWRLVASQLSPEANRELRVLARELGGSTSEVIEWVLEMTAVATIEAAMTARRDARIARRSPMVKIGPLGRTGRGETGGDGRRT